MGLEAQKAPGKVEEKWGGGGWLFLPSLHLDARPGREHNKDGQQSSREEVGVGPVGFL